LAYAGLKRIGLETRISQILDDHILYYAVGQGALAIECRQKDKEIQALVSILEHRETRICVEAEREFMLHMHGGCSVPLGVISSYQTKGCNRSLELKGCIYSPDSQQHAFDSFVIFDIPNINDDNCYTQAIEMSKQLGACLARSLIENKGAAFLLKDYYY
jgi:porphobilinogen deaminase